MAISTTSVASSREPESNSSRKNFFSNEEFECRCKNNCTGKTLKISPILIKSLNKIRANLGSPITITSGVRCEAHNKGVGGVPNSYHVRGLAVDIRCKPDLMAKLLDLCRADTDIKGIGVANSFIHIDVRNAPTRVEWVYK